jgi:hypothetical protein
MLAEEKNGCSMYVHLHHRLALTEISQVKGFEFDEA